METRSDHELGFSWPPRPTPPQTLAAPEEPAYWRWPSPSDASTRAIPEHSVDLPSAAALATPVGWLDVLRAAWRDIEHTWLGPVSLPISESLRAADWSPDARELYCARCGSSVGPSEETDSGCAACRSSRLPWDQFIRLGDYAGPLRRWIHETKFQRFRARGHELGRLLAQPLAQRARDAGLAPDQLVIVPVPSHWTRRWLRGIDHTKAICAGLQRELHCRILPALRRSRGPSQRAVPASQRASNVRAAFAPRKSVRMENVRACIVVDDVKTTGATMRSACKALRAGLPRDQDVQVWAAVLGVTPWRRAANPPAEDVKRR